MNKYLKAQSWCLDQGIKVYIVPIKQRKECNIEVNDNGVITKSPHTYKDQSVASSKIWDLILYLYEQSKVNGKN
jgi:hypothetical protein